MAYILFPDPTPLFPFVPTRGWSVFKKIISSSRVTIGATGRECQLATAVFPRWAFTLTYGGDSWLRDETQNIVMDPTLVGFTELQQISSLFLACRGSYGEFFFIDPDDNSRANQFVGFTDGISATYTPVIGWGTGPFTPSFFSPVQGIDTIGAVYFDGVIQPGITFNLDDTRTQISFPTLIGRPGITVTADLSFYYRCRFLEDNQKYSQFAQNLWEAKEIRFESVKP